MIWVLTPLTRELIANGLLQALLQFRSAHVGLAVGTQKLNGSIDILLAAGPGACPQGISPRTKGTDVELALLLILLS